jgi:hypothetical protein
MFTHGRRNFGPAPSMCFGPHSQNMFSGARAAS